VATAGITRVDGSYWDTDESHARLCLHHLTLPTLADTGILDYDPRSKTAWYRRQPAVEQLLDAATSETGPE